LTEVSIRPGGLEGCGLEDCTAELQVMEYSRLARTPWIEKCCPPEAEVPGRDWGRYRAYFSRVRELLSSRHS